MAELRGHVSGDASEIEASIADAKKEHKFIHAQQRPSIKIPHNAPKLVVAMPMGDKDDPDLFQCSCGHRHFGVVECEECGEKNSARTKLRSAGMIPIEMFLNMIQNVPPLLVGVHMMVRKSIPSAQAREEMTHEARQVGAKYIHYRDDDTLYPPHAMYDLHRSHEITPDAGAISGIYTTREDQNEPLVYKSHGQGSYWEFSTKPGVLEEGFAAGAGCLMAKMECLEDVERLMGRPWWDDQREMTETARIMWGHDVRFCNRINKCGDLYKPEFDIGWMTKDEAVEKAMEQLGITEDNGVPKIAETANEILNAHRIERAEKLIEAGSPRQPWKFYLAGWIQCIHFDIQKQKGFALPSDAPCFRNANTPGYWNNIARKERANTPRQYPAIYDRIVELVPEHSRVVDLGCYQGVLMDRLAKQKKSDCYGYDISEVAIQFLKQRWLEGEVMDLRDFELNHFPANETVVVCTETLEHLDDERFENVLKESSKAKMGIFSVPLGDLKGTPDGEHVREFDEIALETELSKRFERVSVEKIEPDHLLAVCYNGGTDVDKSRSIDVQK